MSQDATGEHRDFFISYTSSDRQWAEWIAWQLEEAGYTLFIQAWDFRPGSNFVAEMERAATCAERTLLVLSAAYLLSDVAFSQWAVAFSHDPRGTHRRLLPVRIEPCEVDGFLGSVVPIDLVSLNEVQAREQLLGRGAGWTSQTRKSRVPRTRDITHASHRPGLSWFLTRHLEYSFFTQPFLYRTRRSAHTIAHPPPDHADRDRQSTPGDQRPGRHWQNATRY